MQYINDPRYREGGREKPEGVKIGVRKRNAQFRASKIVSTGDFTKHKLLHVLASGEIKIGEEPFTNYGEKFKL